MSNALFRAISKGLAGAKTPLASDVNQFYDLLNAQLDAGTLTLAPSISTLSTGGISAAPASGGILGVGAYFYKFTYVTGNLQADGTAIINGETPGSASISVTTTTNNQKVTISGLPAIGTWPVTAIGIRIYRTAVGGADGTEKLVTTLYTNYLRTTFVTSYLDAIANASLGAAVPTTNTTGTSLVLSADPTTALGAVTKQYADVIKNTANAALPSASYTAADVLTKIKTVDGSGSGLDADTLDGLDSTAFVNLTSTQTINGAKTFINQVKINLSDPALILEAQDSGHANEQIKITNYVGQLQIQDLGTAGSFVKELFTIVRSSGAVTTANNTLDDGNGGASFLGNVDLKSGTTHFDNTANGGLYIWESTGQTGNRKALRTNGNHLHVVNSAYTAIIFDLDDTGNLTIPGSLTVGAGGSFANSLGTNGYQKLPGGLIEQWGQVTASGTFIDAQSSNVVVTLPISFPNASYVAFTNASGQLFITAPLFNTLSQLTIYFKNQSGASVSNPLFYWMAIGH